MDRRSFIKGLIALASAPAIGKYVNIFKTEGAREGIEQVASQGVDFFNMVIKKVMDEGTLVKEQDRTSVYKHPDRPDIMVEVDQSTGSSSVYFDTDQGSKAAAEITKTMDETTKGRTVEELMESEEVYKMGGDEYYKDVQEEITGGITNLEEFLKRKRGFADGGRIGFAEGDHVNKGPLGYRPEDFNEKLGIFADGTKLYATPQAMPMGLGISPSNNNTNIIGNINNVKMKQNIIEAMTQAKHSQGTIDDTLKILNLKNGGRVGMFRGGIPKSLQAALRTIMSKYGDDAITTADKAPQPEKTIQEQIMDFNTRTKSKKSAYKPGDVITSENFGDTGFAPDMEARKLAPKMIERMELKARYPGITDELLDSILIDDNPQRKAEVLATLDEIFTMMKKGKGPDEILSMFKNINRTKQADGGSIDGDVSLTVIKIPDISESGVESLFKRR